MALRAIYSHCAADPWVEVARGLQAERGVAPVYWSAWASDRAVIQGAFPGVVFHDSLAAVRGIPAPDLARLPVRALDRELLGRLCRERQIALKMMDRLGPQDSFTFLERERLLYRHLGHWLAALDHLRPHLALFPEPPHLVEDYLLYALCRQRGIATAMLTFAPLPGRLMAVDVFEDGPRPVLAAYDRLRAGFVPGRAVELAPATEAYLAAKQGSYATGRPSHVASLDMSLIDYPWRAQARHWAKLALTPRLWPGEAKAWAKQHLAPAPLNYMKQKGRTPEASAMSGREWRAMRRRGNRLKAAHYRLYRSLCRPPEPGVPHVLVALTYHPEATSCPRGDVYVNQELMVQNLLAALPPGWEVWVKEHFAGFSRQGEADFGRDADFYRDLAALPGVRLLPVESSPFALIDQARAVATLNGSVGMEAVIRGTPVLTFGQANYAGCDGVYDARDQGGLRAALEEIAGGRTPDPELVRLYFKAVEEATFEGYLGSMDQGPDSPPLDENAGRLRRALAPLIPGEEGTSHG